MRHSRRRRTAKQLELEFYRCFLRLSAAERRRVAHELTQPFRRQWYMVDEKGVRRIEE